MSKKHGGARVGSGAKPKPPEQIAKTRSIKVTDADWEKLDEIAKREGLSKAGWLVKRVRAVKLSDAL